jgi:hypothetical protein
MICHSLDLNLFLRYVDMESQKLIKKWIFVLKMECFQPPGPPHPPENCTIKEGPKSQKFLICSPSYNGGLRQTFVLEVL